ncbi:MAG: glycerophosphodiester phosphodiesterase [Bacteroidetes bacterium]|nr:glycerophosphodiester phosphodiesterase [Bacteroidota bacterium]
MPLSKNSSFILLFIGLIAQSLPVKSQFEIQGHRGCRGIFPENTIPAFLKAVDLGVTTLEMDVVITSDKRVLVSHDPFMAHEICLNRLGNEIKESEEKTLNIYQMTAAEAMSFDCGSKFHPRFSSQQKLVAHKPLLSDVISTVETYILKHNLPPVFYNIETKCTPSGDGIFHPVPEVFADLLFQVVDSAKIADRTYIQSFDVRTLQHLKKFGKKVKLVLLVENTKGVEQNMEKLGFLPDVYSPYFKLLKKKDVQELHNKNIKVIPWTVNNLKDMHSLIRKGVDGIITDYPDRLIEIVNRK